jgi:phosphoheptose isomerase
MSDALAAKRPDSRHAEELLNHSSDIARLLVQSSHIVARIAERLITALDSGGTIMFFGNGGSAADAQHLAAELVGRFRRNRRAYPAIALTTDSSIITAVGNDYGFDNVFARQVEALGCHGDVAIGLTTSGRSVNVLKALGRARELGMVTVGLTGLQHGALDDFCDIVFHAPTRDTARIQECHGVVGHVLCELAEMALTGTLGDYESISTSDLLALREDWRRAGLTVVWTNGCFDLLHAGHLSSLEYARALGDVLIVGLNTDSSVRAIKGAGHPLVAYEERSFLLRGLRPVDIVFPLDDVTPSKMLSRLQPEIHVKGADYATRSPAEMPESEVVREYGGKIAFAPMIEARSSTGLRQLLAEPAPSASG